MPEIINPNLVCMGCMQPLRKEQGVCAHCGANNATFRNTVEQLPVRTVLVGKYLVGKALGQGGFGVTYLGWELNLDMKLAIKEYYPSSCVSRQGIGLPGVTPYSGESTEFFRRGKERFIEEARTLAKLTNLRGVVEVRDFFLANNTAYIVMEFVDGKTLKALMAERGDKLSFAEALRMLRPLISDMGKIHEMGIIHRDVSPDNIMIRPNGEAVLVDFGAARAYMGDQPLSAYSMSVKNGYAPLEQYQNGKQGPWTDVYAMAATLYQLATGALPVSALERLTQNTPLKTPSSLGASITPTQERALMDALALEPEKRIQNMQSFYDRLYARSEEDLSGDTGVGRKRRAPAAARGQGAELAVSAGANAYQALKAPAQTPESAATPAPTPYVEYTPEPLPAGPLDFGGNAALESAVREAVGKPTGDVLPADAARVRELELIGMGLTDASPLRAFTGLTTLSLRGNQISDLRPLSSAAELERLDVSGNLIGSLAPLSGLTSLRYLWLNDNRVGALAPRSGLTGLEMLDVGRNRGSDLTPIAGLTALRKLWAQDNPITSLAPVSGLSALKLLSVGNAGISDLSPLSGLTGLERLYLYRNQISDVSALQWMTSLKALDLRDNAIADASPLSALTPDTLALTGNPCVSKQ